MWRRSCTPKFNGSDSPTFPVGFLYVPKATNERR
ncbi:hypothetical protein V3C99_012884 [Haemonchus contortus]